MWPFLLLPAVHADVLRVFANDMKRPPFELERLLSNAWFQWAVVGLVALYFASMFVIPAVRHLGDWVALQRVWDRWQSLNVGVLAFVASYLALQIARVNIADRNRREFIAARAFLPKALSDLSTHCRELAHSLLEMRQESSSISLMLAQGNRSRSIPIVPPDVYQTLGQCIRYAPTDVARFLADILSSLQVVHARADALMPRSSDVAVRPHISSRMAVDCVADAAVLRVQIDLVFPFARFESESIPRELNVAREAKTVMKTLEIPPAQVPYLTKEVKEGLESFSKRHHLTTVDT